MTAALTKLASLMNGGAVAEAAARLNNGPFTFGEDMMLLMPESLYYDCLAARWIQPTEATKEKRKKIFLSSDARQLMDRIMTELPPPRPRTGKQPQA